LKALSSATLVSTVECCYATFQYVFDARTQQHLNRGWRTGDMLRVMSAGLYQPTPHRVINTSGSKTRTSVAFFYEPVRPAPSCALCCGALHEQDINSLMVYHITV
jgi:2OG-Fe(II) oxygenase superfamily